MPSTGTSTWHDQYTMSAMGMPHYRQPDSREGAVARAVFVVVPREAHLACMGHSGQQPESLQGVVPREAHLACMGRSGQQLESLSRCSARGA